MLILLVTVLSSLPSLVASAVGAAARNVAALKTFLAWTLVGWVVSLARAFGPTEKPKEA